MYVFRLNDEDLSLGTPVVHCSPANWANSAMCWSHSCPGQTISPVGAPVCGIPTMYVFRLNDEDLSLGTPVVHCSPANWANSAMCWSHSCPGQTISPVGAPVCGIPTMYVFRLNDEDLSLGTPVVHCSPANWANSAMCWSHSCPGQTISPVGAPVCGIPTMYVFRLNDEDLSLGTPVVHCSPANWANSAMCWSHSCPGQTISPVGAPVCGIPTMYVFRLNDEDLSLGTPVVHCSPANWANSAMCWSHSCPGHTISPVGAPVCGIPTMYVFRLNDEDLSLGTPVVHCSPANWANSAMCWSHSCPGQRLSPDTSRLGWTRTAVAVAAGLGGVQVMPANIRKTAKHLPKTSQVSLPNRAFNLHRG